MDLDINNIALVRATNIIPFDGVIRPLANVPYLNKNIGLEFSCRLSDLLNELEIIPKMDYSKIDDEDYYDNLVSLSSKILKDYLPYVSDYNVMVLFSLNGLCPDDATNGFGNNTFSNKKCAIIEPLKYHINETISLVPTDTAILGDVFLSEDAVVLIEEETYNNLTYSEKQKLSQNCFTIKKFKCSLNEAVSNYLKESKIYTSENLSLSQSNGRIMLSRTSEKLKEVIKTIIKDYNLSDKLYFDLIVSKDENIPMYEKVSQEYSKMIQVVDYMMELFLEELLIFLDAPLEFRNNINKRLYDRYYMTKLVELIKNKGIGNYKKFIDKYNQELERKLLNLELLTPNEIIDKITCEKKNNY